MQLNGAKLNTDFTIREVYDARPTIDLGDCTSNDNGGIQGQVATNDLTALQAAYAVYQQRLAPLGIANFEQFLEQDPQQLAELLAVFRERLGVFFPAFRAMYGEIQAATADLGSG